MYFRDMNAEEITARAMRALTMVSKKVTFKASKSFLNIGKSVSLPKEGNIV
jgi:hypothetical protein